MTVGYGQTEAAPLLTQTGVDDPIELRVGTVGRPIPGAQVKIIDPATGEPFVIQHADPRSFHIRTFSIDPSGSLLVAASIVDMNVRDGKDVRYVPAGLTVFRITERGTLQFVRKYDVELNGKFQWWTGFIDWAGGEGDGDRSRAIPPQPSSID